MDILYDTKDNSLKRKRCIFMVIAIFIGLLLISPKDITWAQDRLNYLVYAVDSGNIMQRYISRGIVALLSNEPLFLLINMLLSFVFSPEITLKIIIFTSILGVLYSLGKISKYNIWVLFFFLFVPQILINHTTHLRQGLALSFYLVGITSEKKYGKFIKYSSMFIHTSFAFMLFFEFLEVLFKKVRFDSTLRILLSTISLTGLVLAVPTVAAILGDRRALAYNFTRAQGSSGLGLLIWLLVGGFFIIISKKDHIDITICYGIIFYLASYFFIDFGARVFENTVPLLMAVTLTDSRKKVRILYMLFFLFYGALQWYLRGGFKF